MSYWVHFGVDMLTLDACTLQVCSRGVGVGGCQYGFVPRNEW